MDRERLDAPSQPPRGTINDPVLLEDYRMARRIRALRTAPAPQRPYIGNAPTASRADSYAPRPDRSALHRERLEAVGNAAVETLPPSVHNKTMHIIRAMRKAGRPFHGDIPVTDELREQVAMMATARIPQKDIAAVLGISTPTLRKYFLDELEGAPVVAAALVGDKALQMALDGQHENMTRFWLRVNGWRETPEEGTKNSNNQVNVMIHVGGVDANL